MSDMKLVGKRVSTAMDLFVDAVSAIKRAGEMHGEVEGEKSQFSALVAEMWRTEGKAKLLAAGIDPAEVEGAIAVVGQSLSDAIFETMIDGDGVAGASVEAVDPSATP